MTRKPFNWCLCVVVVVVAAVVVVVSAVVFVDTVVVLIVVVVVEDKLLLTSLLPLPRKFLEQIFKLRIWIFRNLIQFLN